MSEVELRLAPPAPNADAAARVPRALAFRYDVLPLHFSDGTLTVGVANIDDGALIDQLRRATRLRVRPIFVARDEIRERLTGLYPPDLSFALAADRRSIETPAVRRVDAMFERAAEAHASDVHIEPHADGGAIRLRIDGVLTPLEQLSADLYNAFVSRLKLLAGMDIADRRQPQDGRLTIAFEGRTIDARVASMPTFDGEKLVIRLLDHHTQSCDITALGMPSNLLTTYRSLVRLPWGFIVVTGPTGSGKTTTLYASLADLDVHVQNVCSVEDPIEMRVAGVTQVGVNPKAGVTFASALRGFMRQDPNVIMVGEMRDAQTAAVAISASLAGQLVFTTLHSNDAPRTIERLMDLGVSRASLAAGLSAVLAQRLVRRLCENCRSMQTIPDELRRRYTLQTHRWWASTGCGACAQTGFSGRIGVYELLVINDRLRDAIGSAVSSVALAQLAATDGYEPMFADGLRKVCNGYTTFAELTRVVSGEPPS